MAKREVSHSVVEALNTETSAQYDVQSVLTISTTTVATLIGKDYSHVYLQPSKDIYFTWSTAVGDAVNISNDHFILGGSDIYILRVPQGIGATVYLQLQRKGGTDSSVRMTLA
jgi:hypothetical protein|tara:strand:+ start:501 stop:839 length:339 start_codon:yes stop_codon:yes gene_type:complete